MSNGSLAHVIRGESLLLHPERAVSWPARGMLIIADTHFGKSSVFARHGIAVAAGTDAQDLARIDTLLRETRSDRLLIAGDFLHGPVLPDSSTARELARWIAGLHPVQLLLVTGNHDRAARGWRPTATWEGEQLKEGPFCFTHDADAAPAGGDAYLVSGHVHPVVALGGLRKRRPRVPVFWQRADALILPSFGLFTGGFRINPESGGRVFAAVADCVLEVGGQRLPDEATR